MFYGTRDRLIRAALELADTWKKSRIAPIPLMSRLSVIAGEYSENLKYYRRNCRGAEPTLAKLEEQRKAVTAARMQLIRVVEDWSKTGASMAQLFFRLRTTKVLLPHEIKGGRDG